MPNQCAISSSARISTGPNEAWSQPAIASFQACRCRSGRLEHDNIASHFAQRRKHGGGVLLIVCVLGDAPGEQSAAAFADARARIAIFERRFRDVSAPPELCEITAVPPESRP